MPTDKERLDWMQNLKVSHGLVLHRGKWTMWKLGVGPISEHQESPRQAIDSMMKAEKRKPSANENGSGR